MIRGRRRVVPPLRKGVYLLPSLCTTTGLFSGFYAIILTLDGKYLLAAVAILVAQVLDSLDGRIARMTKTSSHFGLEYDSLSDLVAFGVAPGILVYKWALKPWGVWGWLAASLYVVCGALRLARFNVQVNAVEKQSFVGLPVPAAASLISTIVLMYYFLGGQGATNKHIVLLLVIYALAVLMVSNIRYASFKELQLRHRQPFWILVMGTIVIELIIAEPQIMLFTISLLYTLSGPVRWLVALRHKGQGEEGEGGSEAVLHVVRPAALDSKKETSV
ncbi:MAG: CDP-diacylglycerol--serine O-phosphatidyltransferase [Deltaproteobacteria bacterium]|nr:CDP-diacylglycerol--serine O-phosphatidyltransferase [Deltaproteobacteria bacterium]